MQRMLHPARRGSPRESRRDPCGDHRRRGGSSRIARRGVRIMSRSTEHAPNAARHSPAPIRSDVLLVAAGVMARGAERTGDQADERLVSAGIGEKTRAIRPQYRSVPITPRRSDLGSMASINALTRMLRTIATDMVAL
jgi:hypothetical protein